MHKLLVVLQNPYKKDKLKDGWSPSRWRSDFELSRSGIRLSLAIPIRDDWKTHYTNSNPSLGDHPNSKFEPNLKHLKLSLKRTQPDFVLSCGQYAENAIQQIWNGPLLAIPHPAFRLLTNDLLQIAKQSIINWGVFQTDRDVIGVPRFALRQKKQKIEYEFLEGHQ